MISPAADCASGNAGNSEPGATHDDGLVAVGAARGGRDAVEVGRVEHVEGKGVGDPCAAAEAEQKENIPVGGGAWRKIPVGRRHREKKEGRYRWGGAHGETDDAGGGGGVEDVEGKRMGDPCAAAEAEKKGKIPVGGGEREG